MKKLIYIPLIFCLLCACEADRAPAEGTADTPEELFLQDAYWYLQSDEKDIFSWEDGVPEDFCSEEPREIISPEGLTDIQGMELRRVCYKHSYFTEQDYEMVSLYFDGDGSFVGTDYSAQFNGDELLRTGGPWSEDVSIWLFLEKKEMLLNGTQTMTCVMRNTGQKKQMIAAYAPNIMAVSCYQNGKCRGSGLASAAQEITLKPGEVYVETQTVIPEDWNRHNWMPYEPGPCTVAAYVPLAQEAPGLTVTLCRTATFTITE